MNDKNEKIDLKSINFSELEDFIISISEPKYRASQIFSWLYKGVSTFDEMTDISKKTRDKLDKTSYISVPFIDEKYISKLDGTIKYLWRLFDGECIESVLMSYEHGLSICLSTQAGCRMGCKFCASTKNGLLRNLTAGEISNQLIFAEKDIGNRISNIVLMGIGEPLDNYDNVVKFLQNINHEKGKNIGYRHISLSTCGLCDKIYDLAALDLPITLSVSLHAPNDEIRQKIMPVAKKWDMDTLLKTCRDYIKRTNRRISFEYTLISGENDSILHARELAKKLEKMLCHVNLIPVNVIAESKYIKSQQSAIAAFCDELLKNGINTTVRRTLGADINASCGQLRNKNISV